MRLSTIVLLTYIVAVTVVSIAMTIALSAMVVDLSSVILFMEIAVSAMTLSSLISYFLMKPTYQSLKKMSRQVEHIADGQFNTTVDAKGPKELQQLATSINEMAKKIETMILDLKTSEKEKRELMTNLSHDIKTPIASIQSVAEALVDGVVSDKEETDKYLHIMKRESLRLNEFVNQMMDISMLSNDSLAVQKRSVRIDQLILDVLETFEATIEQEERSVNIQGNHVSTTIQTDEQLLRRVLSNVVQNALQFSPSGSELGLNISEDERQIEFSIQDKGMGIPQSELPHIFNRTYRVEKSRNKKLGGNGLGLHIAKELVNRIGGAIYVQSEVGKGSCFRIVLWK